MEKPIIVKEIEGLMGFELHLAPEYPDPITGLMMIKNGQPKYAMDGEELIGLNLAGVGLTDKQWKTIQKIEGFKINCLQALHLGNNRIEAIEFSKVFSNLRQLDLSQNSDLIALEFTSGLPNLLRLNLDGCALEGLDFPKGFSDLEFLQAVSTKLQTVTFSGAMPSLEYLDLSENEIKQLILPSGFDSLQYFYFRENRVTSTINFQEPVPPFLNSLNFSNSKLYEVPAEVIFGEHLESLNLKGNVPKNVPNVFLGVSNCIDDARDWFAELRDFPYDRNKAVKLMLTGNSNAGKTTLLCALKNGSCDCQPDHSSTHGIQIESWKDGEHQYNTWDFGGQEVYHGTHRLFMSSEAIQLILYTPDVQKKARNQEKVWNRIRKEKITPHTVEYWYETIKKLSHKSSFIVVQNKEDLFSEKDKIVRDYADEKKAELRLISAKDGGGVKNLKMFLKAYAQEMPEYGMIMPQSWLNVRQFFIANANGEQGEKIVDQEFFEKKCKEHKVSERTWGLLKRYLHHSGYIYYHRNLGDKIIADQRWALEAIYKPLNGEADHYDDLIDDEGRIRVRRLFQIFGEGYTQNQKWLFLQFLKSCGICFKIKTREEDNKDSERDLYLFPEFLKSERPDVVDRLWGKAESVYTFKYNLEWLNYHVIQGFITRVGRKTDTKYIWKTGIYVPTEFGEFKVELDVEGKSMMLLIEEKAIEHLLSSILEELGHLSDNDKWEVLINGKYQSFNKQQWKKGVPFFKEKGIEEDLAPLENEEIRIEKRKLSELKEPIQQNVEKKVILFIAANPPETEKLGSQYTEFAKIYSSIDRKEFELESLYSASSKEMNNVIADYKPTVIHFCGHADKDGLEVHDESKRESKSLEIQTLRDFFGSVKKSYPQLELVMLNACLSSRIAKAISQNNIYAIGTSDKLRSIEAIPFAESFYYLFSKGRTINESVEHGIRACGVELEEHNKDLVEIYFNGEKQKK